MNGNAGEQSYLSNFVEAVFHSSTYRQKWDWVIIPCKAVILPEFSWAPKSCWYMDTKRRLVEIYFLGFLQKTEFITNHEFQLHTHKLYPKNTLVASLIQNKIMLKSGLITGQLMIAGVFQNFTYIHINTA